jgi:hypothetical protein
VRDYPKILRDAIPEILERSALAIEARAKEMAPVDTGIMRSSINTILDLENNRAIVECIAPHAIWMEYGRPPGKMPPVEALEPWAKRHGFKSAWPLAMAIKKRGIEVGSVESPMLVSFHGRGAYRPFMRPAAYQTMPYIRQQIKDALDGEISKYRMK